MGIFSRNLTPEHVDIWYQKRDELRLVGLLRNKNPLIVEKAIVALCTLATDGDAKKTRSTNPEWYFHYKLKELGSRKLSGHLIALDSYIQAIRQEKEEVFKIRHELQKRGFGDVPQDLLLKIKKVIETDENVEYAQGGPSGGMSSAGFVITDKKIIFCKRSMGGGYAMPIRYDSITKINRKTYRTVFTYDMGNKDKGEFVFNNSDYVMSNYLTKYIPKLKDTL